MVKKILIGIDGDGTINKDPGFFGKDDDWKERLEIHKGVVEGLKLLKGVDAIKTSVITNASGIPWRYYTLERAKEINNHINSLLLNEGVKINVWQISPYYGESYAKKKGILNLRGNQWILNDNDVKLKLRKPNIGMLKRAAQEMGSSLSDFDEIYVIGDKVVDVETGVNAGGKGILVYNGLNKWAVEEIKNRDDKNQLVASDFYEACKYIVKSVVEEG